MFLGDMLVICFHDFELSSQGRTKWRNCRLTLQTPDYQLGWAGLAASRHPKTHFFMKRKFSQPTSRKLLPNLIYNIITARDVFTGATGATEVAPKFLDSLTLSPPCVADSAHHRRGSI